MKFSQLYAPTLKESPKDAVLPSHQLLVRAGFVQQIGAGLYNFLPLGLRVLERVKRIIREEMNATGAQEIAMSFVVPAELWRQSGRYERFGAEMLRARDRKDGEFLLAPTHEESITDLVRNRVTSYKQLPLNLYQIGLKFRDEARPRFGLLRCREFVMKDAYSFHASAEDLRREFGVMRGAYERILARMGFDFCCVEADCGSIGGSASNEFMVLAKNGEDDILISSNGYAANVEAARRARRSAPCERPVSETGLAKFATPGANTIAAVAEFFKVDEFFTIKAVIKKAIFAQTNERGENLARTIVFFVRGDEELQETKAANACGALELVDADEADVRAAGLVAGYCGPLGLPAGAEFYIDEQLRGESEMICGANEPGYHFVGVKVVNFNESRYADIAAARAGDTAPDGGTFALAKGIEVGHIFQLGTKYSRAMKAEFLDENGRLQPFAMGCYGIGVSRLVAVGVEASHDERGCVWARALAPFDVHLIVGDGAAAGEFAAALEAALAARGVEALRDERKERFGSKMADFELIGVPLGVIIAKGLQKGEVELIVRRGLVRESFALPRGADLAGANSNLGANSSAGAGVGANSAGTNSADFAENVAALADKICAVLATLK